MVKSKSKRFNKTVKIVRNSRNQTIAAAVVIVAAAILGYFLFIASHASTPYVSAEAESGQLDSGGIAQKITDTNASGSSAVQFGTLPGSGGTGGNGHPLLGLWDQSSIGPSQLGVTQQATLIFASTDNNTGNAYCAYSSLSSDLAKGTVPILSIGDCTSSEATAIASYLVNNSEGSAYIRPMWEMNQNVSGWFQSWNELTLSASQYISAWQTMYTAMKAISPTFKFIWCPNDEAPGTSITQNGAGAHNNSNRNDVDTYPGDAYVDYVGLDIYDWWSGSTGDAPAFEAFASSHKKPMVIPEWGLNGSNDPTFINSISSFVHNTSNNVALQSYFSYNGSINSDLSQSSFSSSKSAYSTDFAGE